ncbi:MAG: DUF4359 domain-containing protein [Nitrospiraceae bacterium]
MSNTSLAILAVVLGICVALALTNPTSQDYGAFLQTKLGLAVAQMDQSLSGQERTLFHELYATQGKKLIELVLQKHTQRRNFGLFSLYESRVLEQRIVVVGVAAQFIPVEGVEEVTLKLGQLVPTLKR